MIGGRVRRIGIVNGTNQNGHGAKANTPLDRMRCPNIVPNPWIQIPLCRILFASVTSGRSSLFTLTNAAPFSTMHHNQTQSQRDRVGADSSYPSQVYATSSQQSFGVRPDSQVYPSTEYPARVYQSQSTLTEPQPQTKEVVETVTPPEPAKKVNGKLQAVISHLKNHVGVGIVCAVAYFDP